MWGRKQCWFNLYWYNLFRTGCNAYLNSNFLPIVGSCSMDLCKRSTCKWHRIKFCKNLRTTEQRKEKLRSELKNSKLTWCALVDKFHHLTLVSRILQVTATRFNCTPSVSQSTLHTSAPVVQQPPHRQLYCSNTQTVMQRGCKQGTNSFWRFS